MVSLFVSGVTFASQSEPDSITITFQQLDIEVNTMTGCACINNGKPIDITDKDRYTIEGLLPGCKYPISFTTLVDDGASVIPIEVGRQEISTSGM